MRLAEDTTSWKASGIQRRDFRHAGDADTSRIECNGHHTCRCPDSHLCLDRDCSTCGMRRVPKPRKRKDTKLHCRGVKGREHELAIRPHNSIGRDWVCEVFAGRWRCWEEEYCTACGKIVTFGLGDRCTKREQ